MTVVVTPPASGSSSAPGQEFHGIEESVVLTLPRSARILHPVLLRDRAGGGVQDGAAPFGELGGALELSMAGAVRVDLQPQGAVLAPVLHVGVHAVGVDGGVQPLRHLFEGVHIENLGLFDQQRLAGQVLLTPDRVRERVDHPGDDFRRGLADRPGRLCCRDPGIDRGQQFAGDRAPHPQLLRGRDPGPRFTGPDP